MTNSWSSVLNSLETAEVLNNNLQRLSELLPFDIDPANLTTRLRNNKKIAFLCLDDNNDVMVLHHFEDLGGTVLHRDVLTFCVEGLDNMINVFAPSVEQCLADCDINTPGWANFISCTSTEELRNLRAQNPRGGNGGNVLRSKALIPIPPKIVTPLAEILETTKEPHEVLLRLIQVYNNLDNQTPSAATKLSIHTISLLQLLWAKGTAPTITFARSRHQLIREFYTTCSNTLHPPALAPQQPAHNNVALNQLVDTMKVGQELALQQATAAAAAKETKSSFESWTSKDWYLRAATIDKINPARQPTAHLVNILEYKNVVEAITALRLTASTVLNCDFPFTPSIAVKLRQGILCGMVGEITGLSIFLCIEHIVDRAFHATDLDAMALQMSEGNKKLTSENSKSLAKEKSYIVYPTEIHQLQQGILTYVHLL